jgi:hypothetical protein
LGKIVYGLNGEKKRTKIKGVEGKYKISNKRIGAVTMLLS